VRATIEDRGPSPYRGSRRTRRLAAYALFAPGLIWLVTFFLLPLVQMLSISLSEGTLETGFVGPPGVWRIQNYTDAITEFTHNFRNSIVIGGLATCLAILISYPVAYAIATRGGRRKNVLLFLVIAPFFTSYLIRVISWQTLLGPDGPLLAFLRSVGLVSQRFVVLGTAGAVVAGLTYQLIPFAVLPLYASIDRIDRRLVEAAEDLYAGRWSTGYLVGGAAGALLFLVAANFLPTTPPPALRLAIAMAIGGTLGALIAGRYVSEAFVRVVVPLSLPGLFAASLLTAIPAMGDYVNASLLGNIRTQMIGNVIQSRFLEQNDYVTAAALAFLGMAVLLVCVALYSRFVGVDRILEDAE
jgi:spermidine/putrescine transport system permease protein